MSGVAVRPLDRVGHHPPTEPGALVSCVDHDAGRAGELLRLNPQLRNPNTLQAGDFLHAYAR